MSTISRQVTRESLSPSPSIVQYKFPYNLIMKVSTSEPRDGLQSERTCLTFIRFATALFFTSLVILLNFRLDTPHASPRSGLSTVLAYLLLGLSLVVLVISGVNYFVTIKRYAKGKIDNFGFNNFWSMVAVTGVIVALLAINVTLLIEEYLIHA
ncbi:uncharacterized protein SPAPADRAFT_135108 [Spathaspora passalidarum NRRL Y-27907]|uniref:DUF202 domain-containing protein n=1 Tax=Spathaspora passalidarum (strain NRRL Y-27907 / 11-Y1) TaxID=619300 RepID=G3AHH2_SPAPN|nr:uncharacterized protein SPAPADRAFT_135108 [Spathaspora passalidarum NRRL Y-27907]EGW34137.1 hypothetical protein SPAPADRAFT_135108 [Spathaspora passalidarum NRRL Y-27907]